WKLFMDAALSGYENQSFPSYSTPVYFSPFNQKQNDLQQRVIARFIQETTEGGFDMISTILKNQKYTVLEEYSDTVPISDVTRVVYEGTEQRYYVYISMGPEDGSLTYADVIGHKETSARYILEHTGFTTIIVEKIFTESNEEKDKVVKQSTYESDKPYIVYDEETGEALYTIPAGTITISISKGIDPDKNNNEV
ncbi:MAG: hypothetical protein J6Y65_02695, partial [Eggerthellaceae bacterium]|nr:hypothetical protein [Eggerthellaceae bacterium]